MVLALTPYTVTTVNTVNTMPSILPEEST